MLQPLDPPLNSARCAHPQLRSLSLDSRLALAWRQRTPSDARVAAPRLVSALHASSVCRHREHEGEAWRLDALVTAFALERRAAELDVLGDGWVDGWVSRWRVLLGLSDRLRTSLFCTHGCYICHTHMLLL
jgi:hypothetical protein